MDYMDPDVRCPKRPLKWITLSQKTQESSKRSQVQCWYCALLLISCISVDIYNIALLYIDLYGPLTRYVNMRAVHAPGMPGTFPRYRGLAIPTFITARAWCTCRGACRNRYLAVSFEVGSGKNVPGMRNPEVCVSGKRPMPEAGIFRVGKVNWIPQKLWNVITCPWPGWLLLVHTFSCSRCQIT